jgi:hypothetical protein
MSCSHKVFFQSNDVIECFSLNIIVIKLEAQWAEPVSLTFHGLSKKSSSLKPLCQINQNLVGSILGRSSIKIAHLVPIKIGQSETKIAYGGHVC